MNALETAIQHALSLSGSTAEANKAYLEFIKANFIVPIEKESKEDMPEVLYLEENGQVFLPAFSSMGYFDAWVREISDQIQVLHLSGVDLLKGVGEQVTVCLNIGSTLYKEFNPAELARMRSMVIKIFK